MLRKKLISLFYKIFDCASIYVCRLNKTPFEEKELSEYQLLVLQGEDLKKHTNSILQKRNQNYLTIIEKRIKSGNYACFVFVEKKSGVFAYTRWTCTTEFYSKPMNYTFHFNENEIFTLNSYTHPNHRYQGLHKEMNIRMLNYFIKGRKYNTVYMVIHCFIPHLVNVVKPLGYKKVETKIFLKKANTHLLTFRR